MPIEIRELHVKAIVGPSSSSSTSNQDQKQESVPDKEAIVAECVRKVLEIMNLQAER